MNRVSTPAPNGDELPLHRAVRALPAHEPPADSWARIAAQLAGEQAIAQALPHLPSHEPAADTWAQVAARLDHSAAPAPVVRPLWRRAWPAALGLAATILLLLAVGVGQGWFRRPADAPGLAAAAWVPVPVAALPPAALPDPLEAQGEAFIEARCTSLPMVCQSGEFRALRAQLTALQRQEQRLRGQLGRRGATPQLVRRQVRVTIRKATVTRELIHLLIS